MDWRPVILFYAKTTSWVAIPLILAVLLGKYASRSTGNELLFFLILLVGFLITVCGIYKEIKEYKKTLDGGK